ncbi:MAG: hypothetical protein WAW41_10910 [Methylobacter sp.]
MSNFDLKDIISATLGTLIGGIILTWLIQVLPSFDRASNKSPDPKNQKLNEFVSVDAPHTVKGWIEKYPVDR